MAEELHGEEKPRRYRTTGQKEVDYLRVASLYVKGWPLRAIAAEVGYSTHTAYQDVKVVLARWRAETFTLIDDAKTRELVKLDGLEQTYWAAWERSLGERVETMTERQAVAALLSAAGDALPARERSRTQTKRTLSDGNPAYLAGVFSCIDRRCKVLGLDASTKLGLDDATLSWVDRARASKGVQSDGTDTAGRG